MILTYISFATMLLLCFGLYRQNELLRREQRETDHRWRQDWIRLASLLKAKSVSEFAVRDILKPPPDPYMSESAPPTALDAEVEELDEVQFGDFSLTDQSNGRDVG